jgi:ankyrin repeat protein
MGILLELERLLARGGVLEEHGATVNSTDGVKQTALMCAAMEGHVEIMDVLVRAGATLDNQAVRCGDSECIP